MQSVFTITFSQKTLYESQAIGNQFAHHYVSHMFINIQPLKTTQFLRNQSMTHYIDTEQLPKETYSGQQLINSKLSLFRPTQAYLLNSIINLIAFY